MRLRARGAFEDGAFPGAAPRHGGNDGADHRDQHKNAGHHQAGEDISQFQRQPVVAGDTQEHESRQRMRSR